MKTKQRLLFLSLLKKKYKLKRSTELIFSNPFEFLIAVILSAQTRDITVNKVTKILFSIANSPKKILSLGKNKLLNLIKNIGLYKTKTKNLIQTCKILLKKYNGKVPKNRIDLESLPGVGRKTSNVILNFIFNKKKIAVDTHVFRVCNRTGFAVGKNPRSVERILLKVVPNNYKLYIHTWFILHGKIFCRSRKMHCKICILKNLCKFFKNQ
ncbi:endonuclease III [Buchnera aphidicola]|uniref:endonuclease III n=1 Tax=Buchnera aphidicola TaxID=9 RepID=UPI002237B423|nr:endonuclease III [Buchnera aphidicola]MCW5197622.1 endonuclease III [Buchnera aphidicola (Chaitophorus viminalis)]